MKLCDYYQIDEQIIGWHTPTDPKIKLVTRCNGTIERSICSCDGDRTRCDFYPEIREKTLKKQKPKFGEWISVKDRLPEKFTDVLCSYPSKNYGSNIVVDYMESDRGYFSEQFRYGEPTHWMPLPVPPTQQIKGGECDG